MNQKILFVDDDIEFSKSFQFCFGKDFDLTIKNCVFTAMKELDTTTFDLLIVDHHIGNNTGIDVIRALRNSPLNSTTPVLVITAAPEVNMAIEYLNSAVQGFLTKPLDYSLILNKIRGQLNQSTKIPLQSYRWIKINPTLREVFFEDQKVTLTPTEITILEVFLKNPGQPITRDEICARIWGDRFVSKNAFDTHLLNLRKKVSPFNEKLTSIYGTGYILNL